MVEKVAALEETRFSFCELKRKGEGRLANTDCMKEE
jgi:hypothetical protein